MGCFSQLPWLPLPAGMVSLPFHIHAKRNFGKTKAYFTLSKFEHIITQLQSQCITNTTNACFVIIPTPLGI